MYTIDDVEDIILTLADIIQENRYLKKELKASKQRIEEYEKQVIERANQLNEGMEILFNAGMAGVFKKPDTKI